MQFYCGEAFHLVLPHEKYQEEATSNWRRGGGLHDLLGKDDVVCKFVCTPTTKRDKETSLRLCHFYHFTFLPHVVIICH